MTRDLLMAFAAAGLIVAILIGGFLAVRVQVVHAEEGHEALAFSVVTDEVFCLTFVGEEFALDCVESLTHAAFIPESLFPDHETYMALFAQRAPRMAEDIGHEEDH